MSCLLERTDTKTMSFENVTCENSADYFTDGVVRLCYKEVYWSKRKTSVIVLDFMDGQKTIATRLPLSLFTTDLRCSLPCSGPLVLYWSDFSIERFS